MTNSTNKFNGYATEAEEMMAMLTGELVIEHEEDKGLRLQDGYWRSLRGAGKGPNGGKMGKDEYGVRNQEGRTWVRDHEKMA